MGKVQKYYRQPKVSTTNSAKTLGKRLVAKIKKPDERSSEGEEPEIGLGIWLDTTDAAIREVMRSGVFEPVKPEGIKPDMPVDVTRLTSEQLGMLYAQMVAMCEWMDWKVVCAEMVAANQEAYLSHVRAEIRLGKSGTVKDKDSKTECDPVFLREELKSLTLTAKAKLLRARLRGYERNAAALSREMSRREPSH